MIRSFVGRITESLQDLHTVPPPDISDREREDLEEEDNLAKFRDFFNVLYNNLLRLGSCIGNLPDLTELYVKAIKTQPTTSTATDGGEVSHESNNVEKPYGHAWPDAYLTWITEFVRGFGAASRMLNVSKTKYNSLAKKMKVKILKPDLSDSTMEPWRKTIDAFYKDDNRMQCKVKEYLRSLAESSDPDKDGYHQLARNWETSFQGNVHCEAEIASRISRINRRVSPTRRRLP